MIKEILDKLDPGEKRRLVNEFDNGFDQYVELPDNKFVGVNIKNSNFEIHEQVGCWSYGKYND